MGNTCRRVVVTGRVQGVFFRDSCRQAAGEHGVHGWVRNRPEGTVEAVFEGGADAVDRMVEWAHSGPPAAVVEQVQTFDEEPQGRTVFEVRATPEKGT